MTDRKREGRLEIGQSRAQTTQLSFALFIESVMLICLVWCWGAAVYHVVCWWGHLRPLQTAANAGRSETVDKRLCNVSMSTCEAVSWKSLYALCFPFTGSVSQRVRPVQLHHLDVCLTECEACYLNTWSILSVGPCSPASMRLIWCSRLFNTNELSHSQ